MIEIKKILVPMDFSPAARAALDYAKALAGAFDASLHILHVLEAPFLYAPTTAPHFREEYEQEVSQQLAELLSEGETERFRAELALRPGSPFMEVARYAREQEVDLIVLGAHGRNTVARVLLGSVAEKVVRTAPCAVMTVPDPEHREAPEVTRPS